MILTKPARFVATRRQPTRGGANMRTTAIGLFLSALFASFSSGQVQDKVLYLTSAQTPQDMLETTTMVRVIADTQVSLDDAKKSLTVHGTPDQLSLAQW